MLKIWIVKTKTKTMAFTNVAAAKRWCEKQHYGSWHNSGDTLELRASGNPPIAEITEVKIEESGDKYTGEIKNLNVRYPFEKLEKGMSIRLQSGATYEINSFSHEDKVIYTNAQAISYQAYAYSVVTLTDAIRLEDDPFKKLALSILIGDPMALDAARDVLKC